MTQQTAPSWTDHNSSDPGITILEALVYSLAALGVTATTVALARRRRRARQRPDS